VGYHAFGNLIATGGSDHYVKLWEPFPEAVPAYAMIPVSRRLEGPHSSVLSVAFSITNQLVCAGTNENSVYLWSTEGKGRLLDTLTAHTSKVVSAIFPDGQSISTGSHDRTIKLFDLNTGYSKSSIACGTKVNHTCLGAQAQTICSAHFDKTVRQYDLLSNSEICRLSCHSSELTSVSISPDSLTILTNSKDHSLKLVDLRKREVLRTFLHPHYRNMLFPNVACFSWDGKYVVAGGSEGQVFIWSTLNGKCVSTLQCERKLPVTGVSWHPAKNQLLAVCGKTISVWEAPPPV